MVHVERSESTWEYLIVPEAERARLDQLGVDGWELIAIGGDAGQRLLYLKRPGQSFRERVTLEQRSVYLTGIGQGRDAARSGE